jgi:DNA end-binding protein Ku
MPPRAIWKGAISFGLVAIPIRLFVATDSKDIQFVTLHSTCNTRLRQRRWCPTHDMEVPNEEIVRAYEYGKEQYVLMDDTDFEDLPVPSLHSVDIAQFIELNEIDPIYFERTYYIEPDGVGVKPFYLLKNSLEESGKVAIGKISLRQKEHLCCVRPYGQGLVISTMNYADEIRGTSELNWPQEETKVSSQELTMAKMLIDQLTKPFDPAVHTDDYRRALENVIAAKLGSSEPVLATPAPAKGKVGDLMEALRASIEAAKASRTATAQTPAAAEAETEEEAAPKRRRIRKAG